MSDLENLKSVICDPEGKASINGSPEDLRIINSALEGLEKLQKEIDELVNVLEKIEMYIDNGSIYASEYKTDEDEIGAIYSIIHEALEKHRGSK
jgi:hypothetical protein